MSFESWLHATAYRLGGAADHEDLVQEGRIAMWRSAERRGQAHAGWMTIDARRRIHEVAVGGRSQLGSERTDRSRSVEPVVSLDGLEPEHAEELAPKEADFAAWAAMAYHHGELARAIAGLSPKQQESVRVVLAGGIMDGAQRAAWVDARRKLRTMLEHLDEGGSA